MCSRLQINLRRSTFNESTISRTVVGSGALRSPYSPYTPTTPSTPSSGRAFTSYKLRRDTLGTSTFLDMDPVEKVDNNAFLSLGNLGEEIVDWSTMPRDYGINKPVSGLELQEVSPISPISPWETRALPPLPRSYY
jgi:hypothetical protein